MSSDTSWMRPPPDWRTQALSVGTWTNEEVVDLIESWQAPTPQGAEQVDPRAFEAFVQEQADIVMALLDENRTYTSIDEFMGKSGADHQRDAVVVALRRAYPQPHCLDSMDGFLTEMAEEIAAAAEHGSPGCEFCTQHKVVDHLRGQLRTVIASMIRYRRERFGLFFRAQG